MDSGLSPWNVSHDSRLEEYADEVVRLDYELPLHDQWSTNTEDSELARYLCEALEGRDLEETEVTGIGHSKGGLMLRYLAERVFEQDNAREKMCDGGYSGVDNPIDNVITLATPHQGTSAALLGYPLARSFETVDPKTEQFQAPKSLTPGSDYLEELNSDGVNPDIDYLNIASENDPLIPATENALIPSDAENVENVVVGQDCFSTGTNILTSVADFATGYAEDVMRDIGDAVEASVAMITDQDPSGAVTQPRIADPKLQSYRIGRLYRESIEEIEGLSGHLTILESPKVHDEIRDFLN